MESNHTIQAREAKPGEEKALYELYFKSITANPEVTTPMIFGSLQNRYGPTLIWIFYMLTTIGMYFFLRNYRLKSPFFYTSIIQAGFYGIIFGVLLPKAFNLKHRQIFGGLARKLYLQHDEQSKSAHPIAVVVVDKQTKKETIVGCGVVCPKTDSGKRDGEPKKSADLKCVAVADKMKRLGFEAEVIKQAIAICRKEKYDSLSLLANPADEFLAARLKELDFAPSRSYNLGYSYLPCYFQEYKAFM